MSEEQGPNLKMKARDAMSALFAGGKAAGPSEAAQLVCQMISQAARNEKDPRRSVADVCAGAMEGLILCGRPLPETALKIMESLADISLIMRAGPQDLMTWVMEGIAEAAPLAGMKASAAIQQALEERYHGVGPLFASLCEKAKQTGK